MQTRGAFCGNHIYRARCSHIYMALYMAATDGCMYTCLPSLTHIYGPTYTRLDQVDMCIQRAMYTWLQQTLYMAATDSISGCMHTCLPSLTHIYGPTYTRLDQVDMCIQRACIWLYMAATVCICIYLLIYTYTYIRVCSHALCPGLMDCVYTYIHVDICIQI